MRTISCECPKCHATMDVSQDKKMMFCPYCGNKLAYDTDDYRVHIVKEYRDEARIIHERNELQRLREQRKYEKEIRRQERMQELESKLTPVFTRLGIIALWILSIMLLYNSIGESTNFFEAIGSSMGLLLDLVVGFIIVIILMFKV